MTTASLAPAEGTRVFRPLIVLCLVLAGVFSFSAYVVLSAYAPDMRGGLDGGAHALSRSAVGFAGLVRLLRAEGVDVAIDRDGPARRDPSWGLLIVTPEETSTPSDVFNFTTAKGPTLVVLPKWETGPDPMNPAWVKSAGLVDANAVNVLIGDRVTAKISRRGDTAPMQLKSVGPAPGPILATGPIAQLQTIAAEGMVTLLTDPSGAAVLIRTADSRLYILSDPDLLNTHGLRDLATARTASSLIGAMRRGDGPVVFDVSLNGFKHSPSLLKLAFQPPFLGATLCLVGAALLMGLHAANRFGAPVRAARALALGKRALAENSAGLIRMAKREPHMAGGYLDLNRHVVARALGAGRLSGWELDAYLDRLGERTQAGGITALTEQAKAVKDRDGLTRFAQRLYQWRVEMTRERR